jgi:hypothetical protein
MDSHDEIYYKKRKGLSIYWFHNASALRDSANVLWTSMNGRNWGDPKFPVYMMLCGMSLELIYKAIVVANNKEPNTKSHSLETLAKEAGLKVKKEQAGMLQIFSEAIIWDGRYPVPNNQDKISHYHSLILKYCHDHEKIDEQLDDNSFLKGVSICKLNNESLNWGSYNELWIMAFDVYWPLHEKEISDNKGSSYFK